MSIADITVTIDRIYSHKYIILNFHDIYFSMDEINEYSQVDSYEERYRRALEDDSTYRNCTGFVKYMLGYGEKETFVSPSDLSENGLLKHIKAKSKIDMDSRQQNGGIEESEYLGKARETAVVGVLVNKKKKEGVITFEDLVNETRQGWMYVHFAIVDPNDPSMVYQRSDTEKKPEHTSWHNFVDDYGEFDGMEMMVVFFDIV
jgi:hypothetical protein